MLRYVTVNAAVMHVPKFQTIFFFNFTFTAYGKEENILFTAQVFYGKN